MENYINKVAVVTGASSGIGAGISKELAKQGCIVIGIARRLEKLQLLQKEIEQLTNAKKGAFHPVQCDITEEQRLHDTFDQIKSDYGIPSILVNNAGLSIRRKLADCDTKMFNDIVHTNARALLLATKIVVKMMSENSIAGHVVNINSIAGQYLPLSEESIIYAGSKHMTRIFAEGIREMITEGKLNIKISNINPGLVRTPMVENYTPFAQLLPTALSVDDIVKACITILDTAPNVLISELTIIPIHQSVKYALR